jgi:hypothetical protein
MTPPLSISAMPCLTLGVPVLLFWFDTISFCLKISGLLNSSPSQKSLNLSIGLIANT